MQGINFELTVNNFYCSLYVQKTTKIIKIIKNRILLPSSLNLISFSFKHFNCDTLFLFCDTDSMTF